MGEIALSSAAFAKGNFHVAQNPIYSLLPGKFYKPIKNEIDLLHVTDYLVPRIKNVPIVSTIHDAIMLKYPDWLEGSKQVKLLKRTILKNFLAKRIILLLVVNRVCRILSIFGAFLNIKFLLLPMG